MHAFVPQPCRSDETPQRLGLFDAGGRDSPLAASELPPAGPVPSTGLGNEQLELAVLLTLLVGPPLPRPKRLCACTVVRLHVYLPICRCSAL
jgi:hypothetical protein